MVHSKEAVTSGHIVLMDAHRINPEEAQMLTDTAESQVA